MTQAKWIGEYHWTHGPLVLATEKARAAIAESLSEPDRKKLVAAGKKKAPLVPLDLGPHALYVLPGANHTRVRAIDAKSALLVRRLGHVNPNLQLPEVMAYEPGWTTEPWTAVKETLVVSKEGFVLFDAIAQHPEAPQNAKRARDAIPLGLPAGKYVVELIPEQKFARGFSVSLLYAHPADHRPELASKRAPPGVPAPLEISKDVARAAKKLAFVETTGGPFLFLPERAAEDWWGVCDEAGEAVFGKEKCDYDRACAVKGEVGTLKVKDATALVLGTPDITAAHLLDDGLLLLRWVGADHAAALLAAALGPGKYRPTKITLESRGEPWILMDSSLDGRTLRTAGKKERSRVQLPKGRYRVEQLQEWNGEVLLDGKKSEVMASAVRLRLTPPGSPGSGG